MRSLISLVVAAALAAPLVGCEAEGRIDDDADHPGRGVGHVRHDHDDDVDVRARGSIDDDVDVRAKGTVEPETDIEAKGSVDVD